MDSTGMKLHSKNDVSGRVAEALVITLELHGITDNTSVNHYTIHTASVLGNTETLKTLKKLQGQKWHLPAFQSGSLSLSHFIHKSTNIWSIKTIMPYYTVHFHPLTMLKKLNAAQEMQFVGWHALLCTFYRTPTFQHSQVLLTISHTVIYWNNVHKWSYGQNSSCLYHYCTSNSLTPAGAYI